MDNAANRHLFFNLLSKDERFWTQEISSKVTNFDKDLRIDFKKKAKVILRIAFLAESSVIKMFKNKVIYITGSHSTTPKSSSHLFLSKIDARLVKFVDYYNVPGEALVQIGESIRRFRSLNLPQSG